MPLKKFECGICGAKAPKRLLEHSKFKDRMAWLRRHRKAKHPGAFRKSTRKSVKARRRK